MLDSKYDDTRSAHVHFTRESCGINFMDFMKLTPFHGNILYCAVKTNEVYCIPVEKETIATTFNLKDKTEYPTVVKKVVRFNLTANVTIGATIGDIANGDDVTAWKSGI